MFLKLYVNDCSNSKSKIMALKKLGTKCLQIYIPQTFNFKNFWMMKLDLYRDIYFVCILLFYVGKS